VDGRGPSTGIPGAVTGGMIVFKMLPGSDPQGK
jgi:hypothetical protein